MGQKKMIPIGVEDFQEIQEKGYYYVDKTGLIRDLLANQAKVTLFTRPRRFGKTLNMSMLSHFFSMDGDKSIFDGLEISKEKELCEKHMGKYPVISLSLRGVEGDNYQEAYQVMADLVLDLASQFDFLPDSEKLGAADKQRYGKLLDDEFGSTEIYCPWDVLNHSKQFVAQATNATREEIERLIASEAIEKEVRLNLTYSEMYDSIENLWSLLFMTGYLTQQGEADGRKRKLAIPNQEVRDIFVTQIQEYFKESIRSETDTLDAFCAALVRGDADEVRKCFTKYLRRTTSIRDSMARNEKKEIFYHGAMTGVLAVKEG